MNTIRAFPRHRRTNCRPHADVRGLPARDRHPHPKLMQDSIRPVVGRSAPDSSEARLEDCPLAASCLVEVMWRRLHPLAARLASSRSERVWATRRGAVPMSWFSTRPLRFGASRREAPPACSSPRRWRLRCVKSPSVSNSFRHPRKTPPARCENPSISRGCSGEVSHPWAGYPGKLRVANWPYSV